MKHRTALLASASLWVLAGCWLLYRGLQLLGYSLDQDRASILVAAGLVIGFIKGRFVLRKSATRLSERLLTLPAPLRWSQLYPKSYLFLLGSMVFLGFMLRFLPPDWRGFVDIAIGTALMQGANAYFRIAREARSV